MSTTLNRTAYNLLVDDDGSGTTGTPYGKANVGDIYDAVDAAFATDIVFGGSVTSNGQFPFPATQNASAGANTLDDYEEGISGTPWTPVIGGAGGTTGQTYAGREGRYIKIGRLVVAWFYAELSAKGTITGNVQIQGLPFTSQASTLLSIGKIRPASLATNWVSVMLSMSGGGTAAEIVGATAAAASHTTNLATADISNSTAFNGVIAYLANA